MKKLLGLLLVCSFIYTASPAWANLSFYQDRNGKIVVEGNSCEDVALLMQLTDDENPPSSDTPLPQEDPTIKTPELRKDGTPFAIQGVPFYRLQNTLLSYVRSLNWKTGFHFTVRDSSFFQRLKMVCSGTIAYSQPIQVQLEEEDPELQKKLNQDLNQGLDQASQGLIDSLQEAAEHGTLQELVRLSLTGLEHAILTDKPFLLLLIDAETYDTLVNKNPAIAELMDDMYIFFSTRATKMFPEFGHNTTDLLKISRLGKGDPIHTFELLALFAKKMYELQQQNMLSAQQEKNIYMWRLRTAFERLARDIKIQKKAAKLARKNPDNQQLLYEISKEEKRKPTIKQEAIKLLRSYNQQQIKELLRKYYGK